MFESEEKLCDLFKKDALAYGFRIFSEYENWDLVLERRSILIGVQAKLKFNTKVIAQCLINNVHFKIILLPNAPRLDEDVDLSLICNSLKLIVCSYSQDNFAFNGFNNIHYFRHRPKSLLKVPEFDYDLPAGVRSPRTVSERKIAICKLEKIARLNGYITWLDVQNIGLDKIPTMYFKYDWNARNWKLKGVYLPSKQWPHIWENLNG